MLLPCAYLWSYSGKWFSSILLLHAQLAAGPAHLLHGGGLSVSLLAFASPPPPIDFICVLLGAKLLVVEVGILLVQL